MLLLNIIEQSLLFLPLICAIYFSYIVLKVTDISVDGTLVLGAATTSQLLIHNIHPMITVCIAILAGICSGICVAFIQYKNRINDIIAGLLMSFMLYSINLNIMGKPNITTMQHITLLKLFNGQKLILVLTSSCITITACIIIMYSKLGLKLRGVGENRILMKKLGLNPELYRIVGLSISGGLAALCGSIMSQMYGYSDINMGFGMAITGIGALVIGLHLISRVYFFKQKLVNHNIFVEIFGCLIGILFYFSITNLLIILQINPINFKLILALIIILFLKFTKTIENVK